jgi:hypothetical protein
VASIRFLALDASRDRARENAELLAVAVSEALGLGDSLGVRAAVEGVSSDAALVYAVVLDSTGSPVLRYDPFHLRPEVAPLAASDVQLDRTLLRETAAHMRMIADPLAGAISKQFPDKFAMK